MYDATNILITNGVIPIYLVQDLDGYSSQRALVSTESIITDHDDVPDDYDDKLVNAPLMTTDDRPHPHPSHATTPTPSLTSQHGHSEENDTKLSNCNQSMKQLYLAYKVKALYGI